MNWLKNRLGDARIAKALANAEEEALYERAAHEIAEGNIRPGLWAKATASADGDDQKARARYLSLRVEQLTVQMRAQEELARKVDPLIVRNGQGQLADQAVVAKAERRVEPKPVMSADPKQALEERSRKMPQRFVQRRYFTEEFGLPQLWSVVRTGFVLAGPADLVSFGGGRG
jgi:hypothetical protein